MKKALRILLLASLTFVASTGNIWATSYDYSDAIGYGSAWHATGEWQRLGNTWNSESSPSANDSSDNGVDWSIGGASTFGHEDLIAGQSVTFRFDMQRAAYGIHSYDQLKAWVDWDNDKIFESSEVIIATQWFKNTQEDGNSNWMAGDADFLRTHAKTDNPTNAKLQKYFYATLILPENSYIGDTWLRARVQCNHVEFDKMTPYGELWQGEVEDYKLTTKRVPEPSSLLLFGMGLLGLAGFGRKIKK